MENERERHPVDLIFREALHNREVEPPPDGWDNIRQALDQRERKGFLMIRRVAAAMLLMLLSLAIGYQWGMHRKQSGGLAKDNLTVQTFQTLKNPLIKENSDEGDSKERTQANADQVEKNNSNRNEEPLLKQDASPGIKADGTVKEELLIEGAMVTAQVPGLRSPDNTLIPMAARESYLVLSFGLKPPSVHMYESDDNSPGEEIEISLDQSESVRKEKAWSIGGQVSPLYAYRDIRNTNEDALYVNTAAYPPATTPVSATEHPVFSYSGGLNMTMSIAKNVKIETGLYYSSMGIGMSARLPSYGDSQVSPDYLNSPKGDVTAEATGATITTGKIEALNMYTGSVNKGVSLVSATETQLNLTQRFGFMEVPLLMRIHLFGSHFKMGLVGGVITNILALNRVYYSSQNGEVDLGPSEDLRKVSYSGSFGLGASLPVYGRWNLSMEPTFRYSVSPFYKGVGYTSHPYSFGVFTGLSYSF